MIWAEVNKTLLFSCGLFPYTAKVLAFLEAGSILRTRTIYTHTPSVRWCRFGLIETFFCCCCCKYACAYIFCLVCIFLVIYMGACVWRTHLAWFRSSTEHKYNSHTNNITYRLENKTNHLFVHTFALLSCERIFSVSQLQLKQFKNIYTYLTTNIIYEIVMRWTKMPTSFFSAAFKNVRRGFRFFFGVIEWMNVAFEMVTWDQTRF